MKRDFKPTPHTPATRARLVWLSPESEAFAAAAPAFVASGYALCEAATGLPDLALVDLRGRPMSARAAQELAAVVRRKSPECGVIYLGAPSLDAAERAHLRRSGDLVLVEDDLAPAIQACRQRLRIRNVAEEAGERLKTIASLTRLSEFPPIATSSAAPAVLIAGAPGARALAAIAAAETCASRCEAAFSPGQAMRAMEAALYDCAVFLDQGPQDPLIGLARTMRRHRRFQDVPIIVVAPEGRLAARADLPTNAESMAAAHVTEDLPARLVALARRARLMTAMRRFLGACAGDGVRDRASGAFTPAFFGRHAARLFARAGDTGRSLALTGVRLAPAADGDFDVGSVRLQTEAARLVSRVTRAEDCVGRIASDTFIVLQCATNAIDAASAARRIEGVIANTMFRSRGARRLFAVGAATAAVERAEGEAFEETLARVLASLKAAVPKTAER